MNTQNKPADRQAVGLLVGAVLITVGLLVSILIREAGGSAILGGLVSVVFNLLGAIVLGRTGDRKGVVIGAMVVMIGLSLLPLLWVADADTWMRENPILGGVLILIASSLHGRYKSAWPMYVIAILMGGAQILISFF